MDRRHRGLEADVLGRAVARDHDDLRIFLRRNPSFFLENIQRVSDALGAGRGACHRRVDPGGAERSKGKDSQESKTAGGVDEYDILSQGLVHEAQRQEPAAAGAQRAARGEHLFARDVPQASIEFTLHETLLPRAPLR